MEGPDRSWVLLVEIMGGTGCSAALEAAEAVTKRRVKAMDGTEGEKNYEGIAFGGGLS